MNITTQKNKPLGMIVISILALIVVVALALLLLQNNRDSTDTDKPEATKSSDDRPTDSVDAKNKQDFLDNQKDSKDDPDNSTGSPAITPGNQSSSNITISTKTENDNVVITTNLASLPSGMCRLTISGNGNSISKTAQVMYTPTFSSCAGFSIEKSEINSDVWTIELEVTSPAGTQTKTMTYRP